MSVDRAAIVAAARAWIGTPYVHQQSLRGAGCDCLGLVRGVWREVYGAEPELPPPYSSAWAEIDGTEQLRDAARRHLAEIAREAAREGSVLLFRWKPRLPAKHLAIVTGAGRIVHAYQGHDVQEVPLPDGWRRRIAHAFDFPRVG